jgi:hypothetical protein
MSPQLKLQKRDDPLAVNREASDGGGEPADVVAEAPERESTAPEAAPPAAPPEVAPRPARTRPARQRARRSSSPLTAESGRATTLTYDDDRLEQTGWRIYDSLLDEVRNRARELTEAGIPTSVASLAAATLHSRLPRTVEEGSDVMRAFRQASAGRAKRGRADGGRHA